MDDQISFDIVEDLVVASKASTDSEEDLIHHSKCEEDLV